MASDIIRLASGFYRERIALLARTAAAWRRQAMVLGGVLGLPLIALPLALALSHFVLEERFNQSAAVRSRAAARPCGMPEAA